MSAFYFGPSDRQLFGYHHLPRPPVSDAVLICPSWGGEYEYAHRALVVLSKRLAGRGCHVLRFDYSGTGDSWGDSTDADLHRWREDVDRAVDELRAASGREQVSIVGLRLGAAVAAGAGAVADASTRLVLWDPIVDGDAWVAGLGSGTAGDDGLVEFGRSLVTRTFVDQIAGVGPETFEGLTTREVLLLLTAGEESSGSGILPEAPRLERVTMEQPSPWVEDESIWTGQVPVDAVRTIAEWVA